MRERIKKLLEQALQNLNEFASGEISEKLYLNFLCDDKYWGVDLAARGNPASRIKFTAEILKAEVEIESIEVSSAVQRKGIGTLLFSGMLEIVEVMNNELKTQGLPIISAVYGELRPYDPPYDQYEKSIPFYMKQAQIHNLGIQFHEDNEATFEKKEISFEEALGFIDAWKCGSFRYTLN